MAAYKELYFKLFNKLTDISLEIQTVQQEAEELFLAEKRSKAPDQEDPAPGTR